jgi:F-type H+-transporting ATPase subunit b
MRIKNIALLATVLIPSLVLASGAEHHDITMSNSDFFYRVFNFTIFAGLVYYLVANPIKEFFVGRSNGIANQLKEIEDKLQASRDAKKEAEANLSKAELKAKEIISDAANEAKLLSTDIASKNEAKLEMMEKQIIEKEALEVKKATRSTIDDVLSNGIENDDITITEAKVVSLISKKVA